MMVLLMIMMLMMMMILMMMIMIMIMIMILTMMIDDAFFCGDDDEEVCVRDGNDGQCFYDPIF